MRKPHNRIVPLFLCLSLVLFPVQAAASNGTRIIQTQSVSISPETFCDIGAGLTAQADYLQKTAFIAYSSGGRTTYYTVTLQQKSGSNWSDYDSYSGASSASYIPYSGTSSPPHGYTYRLRLYAYADDFPGMETYSSEVRY